MTAPVRSSRGSLGSLSIAPGATGEFEDLTPPADVAHLVFFVRTTRGGLFRLQRIPVGGVARQHIPTVTVGEPPPTEEEIVKIDVAGAVGSTYRVFWDNNNVGGANATVSLEVSWERT